MNNLKLPYNKLSAIPNMKPWSKLLINITHSTMYVIHNKFSRIINSSFVRMPGRHYSLVEAVSNLGQRPLNQDTK